MEKRFRIISVLLVLSIIFLPLSLAFNDIVMANEMGMDAEGEGLNDEEIIDNTEESIELEEVLEGETEEESEIQAPAISKIALMGSEETPFNFDETTGTIKGYKIGNPPLDLVIPATINGVAVRVIGKDAFKDKKLNSVELPEGLESLEYMAFQKNNLTQIILPSTLINLGERSLAYNNLTTIEFPASLSVIGKTALMENKIEHIEIPAHITEIQEGAFNTNLLTSVILNEGLKILGNKAFENNAIEEITIPETVENWPSKKDNPIFRRNNKDINNKGDLILAKVYNNSGATAKNTFGIVNPASVIIEYKDSNGVELATSKTIVGKELKKAEKQGTAWNAPTIVVDGSGEDLLNYDAELGYKLVDFLDEISENYYQIDKEYTFEALEIEDYPTPVAQTVTLDSKENTITFIYANEGGEDLTKPAKVELSFPGGKQVSPLRPEGKQIICFKVFDGLEEEVTGETVTFESSNPEVLNHSFFDTFEAGEVKEETEVIITATLKSNEEIKGEIKVIVTPKVEEDQDEKYIKDAIESLKWFKLKVNSDEDTNVNVHMKNQLVNRGFGDINVSVKSSDKVQFIDLDGNIFYRFDEKYLKSGLQPMEQVALTFEFTKGQAKADYPAEKEIRTVVGWDRSKARGAIENNIILPMSNDLIGTNESLDKIKANFQVPTRIEYTMIDWESSDESILKIKSGQPLEPINILITRGKEDKNVTLTAKVKFNHDDGVIIEKKYGLKVLALENAEDTEESMQKLLDENYTVDKLKNFVDKQTINPDEIKGDISLLIPRNTGIVGYDNYKFEVISNSDLVVINSYRANVYRPLPGEVEKVVNLTVKMKHKDKDITVSKVIPIKVIPLSQKEIDEEIALMGLAKSNYFQLIKGDNININEITNNLKAFREVNLVNGKLVWTSHIDDDKNTGIYPDELEGSQDQEQWRLFRSSHPEIIKHENLIVTKPKNNTDVKIESTLSSKVYGKYAAKYPEREDFKSLYKQDISVIVNVLGKEATNPISVKLDEEIDFLKLCYEAYMKEDSSGNTGSAGLSMLAPGAARLAGMDVDKIQKNIYIDDKNESAYQLSQSIITLIGADLDPRQYKEGFKVRDLVQELVNLQQNEGENIGEFVGTNSDKNSIEAQARAIIALDMAGAEYKKEKIVSKLMEIYEKKSDSHTYKDIKTEGIVLIALSNHKDIVGVENKIAEILNYLKTQQNEDGGFDIKSGFEKGINSPTATGRVIQGLIANGINPLEDEEWIKNGSTILDAIVKSKTIKDDMKKSGYGKGVEDEYTYYEATYTAFGGLMDLKNQKSMFELLKLEVETDVEASRIEIVKRDNNQIEAGKKLALITKVYDEKDNILQGKELIWTSSNENIATVNNGNIDTKSLGEVTITVTVKGTEIKDTIKITVVDEIKTFETNTAIVVFDKEGKYEVKSNAQKVTIDKDKHNGGFTVYGALQATTSDYVGTGMISSIYGITGPSTGGWMFSVNGEIPNDYANKIFLKEGDKVIWFCTYDYKTDIAPTWKDLTDEEVEENLSIKIITDKNSIKVGEKLPLTAEVLKGDLVITDKEVMWLSSNAEVATIVDGKVIAHKAGEVTITVALVENKDIKQSINIKVVEEDKEEVTIEKVIEELREYYSKKEVFTFREALGYNYTSDNLVDDLVEISSKFKINKNPDSASAHVGNIMSLVAAGQDPYNYNGKDYVEPLVKVQDGNGKFIIGEWDDSATAQAFSVLALDMGNASYNKEKAINALLSYQDESGSFGGVDETGMVLGALGKYKGDVKVQTAINKGLNYLKGEQDGATGGFIIRGSENPYSASAVIQGLIAVGENPLSAEWTKNGKTMVDSLLSFYKDGYFENVSQWGTDVDMITEQGFIALADVYKGKSMFNEMKFNSNSLVRISIQKPNTYNIVEGDTIKLYATGYDKDGNIVAIKDLTWTSSDEKVATVDENGIVLVKKSGKVTINVKVKDTDIKANIEIEVLEKEIEIEYIGDVSVEKGKQAEAKIRIKNLSASKKPATLIIGLYEKNSNKLMNYSTITRNLESEEEVELSVGFLVPETGEHYIKAFIWDSLEAQNIIMKDLQELKLAN